MECVCYCSWSALKWTGLSCNGRHRPRTRRAIYLEQKQTLFLIMENPFKQYCNIFFALNVNRSPHLCAACCQHVGCSLLLWIFIVGETKLTCWYVRWGYRISQASVTHMDCHVFRFYLPVHSILWRWLEKKIFAANSFPTKEHIYLLKGVYRIWMEEL